MKARYMHNLGFVQGGVWESIFDERKKTPTKQDKRM